MVSHRLTLGYALAPGWLAPFADGLTGGIAMARRCGTCRRTSFPPLRTCQCGAAAGDWIALPGTAQIRFRTSGSDGDFALVRFDGADTSATVRVRGIAPDRMRGQIEMPDGPLPMMILGPIDGETMS